ncbi:MAG: tetratricopeptide repeat protein [Treponema sp.]|nr:tetratricopeptide repeat protein [Treponema sp.]
MIEQPDKLNNQAIQLSSEGDFASAIACFKRAILLQQDNYLLWYNLGVTYRDAGELSNARNALKKAYDMKPSNEDVVEALVTVCLQLERISEAAFIVKNALNQDHYNSRFWNLLGVTYFQKEKYEEACSCFEDAVSLNPYYKDALFNLRDTYNQLDNTAGELECAKRLSELK